MDDADLHAFVERFRRLTDLAHERLPPPEHRYSPLADRLTGHLGGPARDLPVITEAHAPYDQANLQLAIDAWRAAHGEGVLCGISGGGREHHSFTELLSGFGYYGIGSVDYTTVPTGIDAERSCVRFGLYLLDRGGMPLAVLVRAADPRREPVARLEVMCRDEEAGRAFLAEIRELMLRHNVFRGQVLSFEAHEFGSGLGPLRFHRRPSLARTEVVLPEGVLEAVERQVIGVARHRTRLREAGHALKRGVLLFGPPGTGKTHTVRYLLAQLPEFTAVLLSGLGLQFIRQACALARLVQPALVVLEDVDLVAESRSMRPGMDNPLLFQVLNEMDGLAGDADVAFLLTTNRVDLLEPALAQRPGRVDLAVEVPLPDAAGRQALLHLYGRGLRLTPGEAAEIVAGTEGVTASFFAELARRAELLAASDGAAGDGIAADGLAGDGAARGGVAGGGESGGSEATGVHVRAALAEMTATRDALAVGVRQRPLGAATP